MAEDRMGYVIDLVDWYTEVLNEDPASEVFVPLAEALYLDERWEDAAATCRKGLRAHPGLLRGRVLLGLSLLKSGRLDEGSRELERARWELERNAELYNALAALAKERGDEEQAERFAGIYGNMEPGAAKPFEFGEYEFDEEWVPPARSYKSKKRAGGGMRAPASGFSPEVGDFLSFWLQRAEERNTEVRAAVVPLESPALFEEEERETLRRLLAAWKGRKH